MGTDKKAPRSQDEPLKERLVLALRSLRGHSGMTPHRLAAHAKLWEQLAPIRSVADKEGLSPSLSAGVVIRRFVQDLGTGAEPLALANALNLDGDGAKTLTARREAFAEPRGITIGTVENYENAAIDDVVELLLGHSVPRASSQPARALAPGSMALLDQSRWANPYNYFNTIMSDSTLVFESSRIPCDFVVRRVIQAKIDGIDRFVTRFQYTGSGSETKLEVLEGGELVKELEPSLAKFTLCEIDLQKFLRVNETHEIVYRVTIKDGDEPVPFHTYQAVGPTPKVIIRTHFRGERPARIGRIVSNYVDFPHAYEPMERLFPDEEGKVETTFSNLLQGYSYGHVWEWSDTIDATRTES